MLRVLKKAHLLRCIEGEKMNILYIQTDFGTGVVMRDLGVKF